MKKHYLLLAIILLSSCGKVLFQTPQPEKAERIIKIPQNLWGFYLSEDDTLIFAENSFQYRSSLSIMQKLDFDLRNEEVILKKSNNKYYLNLKSKEDNLSAWMLFRFEKKGRELDVRYIESLDSLSLKLSSKDSFNLFNNLKVIEKDKDNIYVLKPVDFNIIDKLFDKAKSKIFKKD